jgi:hypothetical protein
LLNKGLMKTNYILKGEKMTMKDRFIKTLLTVIAITMFMISFTATGKTTLAAAAATKSLDAGSTWVVNETITLTSLTIAKGASIKAPEGYSVTMSVDGVGTAAKAGDYKGKIVLTVTKEIKMGGTSGGAGGGMPGGAGGGMPSGAGGGMPSGAGGGMPGGAGGGMPGGGMPSGGMPGGAGGGMPDVAGGFPGGDAGGGMGDMPGASEITRVTPGPFKAAVYVENGKYIAEKSVTAVVAGGKVTDTAAKDVKITSSEPDFNGIIVTGDSKFTYTITNPVINLNENGGDDATGQGKGILVDGKADVTVNNAKIVNHGANRGAILVKGEGTLHVNDSYIETNNGLTKENVSMVVPWTMGLAGNVRSTNVIDSGTVYYTNTHLKSQGWGVLSTDGPKKIRLYATKCLVETVESGYGAFTIGDCIDTFSACTFNVNDIGLIVCDNASGTFTDGTIVNSGRFGVMMHTGTGGGVLTIEKGSIFNTKETTIQVKGRGTNIVIDNAKLNPGNGIIIQNMAIDDPFLAKSFMGTKGFSRDVNAAFSNMTLKGDIINGDTVASAMDVTFRNATITGAITTAIARHATGPNGEDVDLKHPELYKLIGSVINTFCDTKEKFGVKVTLDEKSSWVVDKTSYLTGLTIARDANITAPKGYSVTMTVDGAEKPIKAGDYKGKIVLTVKKS